MYREGRSYYDVAGISAEEVIDGLNLLHREGAAVKYLFRCNKVMPKGEVVEDLKKCRHYLSRCKEYSPPSLRGNRPEYYIQKINADVFDEDIYNALIEVIEASGTGAFHDKYEECIDNALYFINNAIEKY